MRPILTHSWDISPDAAMQLQTEWADRVICADDFDKIRTVAGVDVAYLTENNRVRASIVVLDAENLTILDKQYAEMQVDFPYISGLFSFREIPPLLAACGKLTMRPDLIICDGQGIAHPRRFGLASHLGVLFDIPTIGCAKTHFFGEYLPPDRLRGTQSPITHEGEILGAALRTQTDVKPVFVSIGHKMALATACEWILKLAPRFRLPETTRVADHYGRYSENGR